MICAKLSKLCPALKESVIINRPSAIVGSLYPKISSLITSNITRLITGQGDLIKSLKALSAEIDVLLGFIPNDSEALNLGVEMKATIKKVPTQMGSQFAGLILVMLAFIGGIYYYKNQSTGVADLKNDSDPLNTSEMGFTSIKMNKVTDMEQIEI